MLSGSRTSSICNHIQSHRVPREVTLPLMGDLLLPHITTMMPCIKAIKGENFQGGECFSNSLNTLYVDLLKQLLTLRALCLFFLSGNIFEKNKMEQNLGTWMMIMIKAYKKKLLLGNRWHHDVERKPV